ncbi:MAG: alpha-amylase family protein [Polyangiaceae bacterium]|nr:alpha-amylase family protein [Polyangiaceae bacterium]
MRTRQVHLDFHTSEKIAKIGVEFDPKQFQQMLKLGYVNSITVFSKCHHGLSYHPTRVGQMHPNLKFDLLAAQIKAAHAIDVKTPVYLSAGIDEWIYWRHPEWARRSEDGGVPWAGAMLAPGFHECCMNTPYLDYLLKQIEEALKNYEMDGLFLDIVSPRVCYCTACTLTLRERGKDPSDVGARNELAREVYLNYTKSVRKLVDKLRKGLPIFHNGGHIPRGDRQLVQENTHLELESLPTGGWGYDHFPISAGYARTLKMPFLGMTGKFHESWGEFGGFKHPNALRYEARAAAAFGACVSVGDQLHPSGSMEQTTYRLIGQAYAEIEEREPWLIHAQGLADVGLLSAEACSGGNAGDAQAPKNSLADDGAARVLLEGKLCFDVLDLEADFNAYRVLVLPDGIRVNSALLKKLKAYVAKDGQILATGVSGLLADKDEPALDFGYKDAGACEFDPDYIRPKFELEAWDTTSFLVYGQGRRWSKTATGKVLATRDEPYFNRTSEHFCSHRHSPPSGKNGGPVITRGSAGIACTHPLFSIYASRGQQVARDLLLHCLADLLPDPLVSAELPAAGRVTVCRQAKEKRDIVHLLFAQPSRRGQGVEVIEDVVPLFNVGVSLRRKSKPSRVVLEPEGRELPFTYAAGRVNTVVPTFELHQMVVFED